MAIVYYAKKAVHRIWRIALYRHKVYGKVGKNNRYTTGTVIYEEAVIGSNNYFGPRCMLNNVRMGNFCSIAPDVKIGQAEHDLTCISTYGRICESRGYKMSHTPAVIGDNVWIAANAVVKQGIEIGEGSVIGAGAVVTKNIPPYSVAVGIPAKVIRTRFSEKQISEIKSKISWNKNLQEVKRNVCALHNEWETKNDEDTSY